MTEIPQLSLAFCTQRLHWDAYPCDFEFIFSDNNKVAVPSFLAESVSGQVSRMRRCDVGCNSLTIPSTKRDLYATFKNIISAVQAGKSLPVSRDVQVDLILLSVFLDSPELASQFGYEIDPEDIEPDHALVLMQYCESPMPQIEKIVAMNFHRYTHEQLQSVDSKTMERILSHPRLTVLDEDWLCNLIIRRAKHDLSFAPLLGLVYMEYLTSPSILRLIAFVDHYLMGHVAGALWSRLSHLIATAPLNRVPSRRSAAVREFPLAEDEPLNGIIRFLTHDENGNAVETEEVRVTSNSVFHNDPTRQATNLLDLESQSIYNSDDHENVSICYDFQGYAVELEAYTLKSTGGGSRSSHLISWVIEGSNDLQDWMVLDERNDCRDLVAKPVSVFTVRQKGSRFRYIRLRQTGKNSRDRYYLSLTALEMFGKLAGL